MVGELILICIYRKRGKERLEERKEGGKKGETRHAIDCLSRKRGKGEKRKDSALKLSEIRHLVSRDKLTAATTAVAAAVA